MNEQPQPCPTLCVGSFALGAALATVAFLALDHYLPPDPCEPQEGKARNLAAGRRRNGTPEPQGFRATLARL